MKDALKGIGLAVAYLLALLAIDEWVRAGRRKYWADMEEKYQQYKRDQIVLVGKTRIGKSYYWTIREDDKP